MLNFIHLTDCHLGNTSDAQFNEINTYESLRRVCEHVRQSQSDMDFVLVTGDISQTGTRNSYELFASLMSDFLVPVYCLPGNHDDPQLLKEFYPNSPVEHVSYLQRNGIVLFLLNTTVKDQEYGQIAPDTIHELEYFFTQNPRTPAIIAMHHPVISCSTPWMDRIGVQDADKFLQYFQQLKNVNLVINGHVHMDVKQEISGKTFLSTPSTCYQFKKGTEDVEYDNLAPGYRVIKICEGFDILSELIRVPI